MGRNSQSFFHNVRHAELLILLKHNKMSATNLIKAGFSLKSNSGVAQMLCKLRAWGLVDSTQGRLYNEKTFCLTLKGDKLAQELEAYSAQKSWLECFENKWNTRIYRRIRE